MQEPMLREQPYTASDMGDLPPSDEKLFFPDEPVSYFLQAKWGA